MVRFQIINKFYHVMALNQEIKYDMFNTLYAKIKKDLSNRGDYKTPWALY